jgi:hypothetical protein
VLDSDVLSTANRDMNQPSDESANGRGHDHTVYNGGDGQQQSGTCGLSQAHSSIGNDASALVDKTGG